jgi:CPA2 family monovalent cation:H+ antiporter-2
MWQISRTGSRELFTLSVVAAALGIAFGAAKLFGVSFALGAFFAGMVMRESEFSQRAAEESLPLRDAFAVLFFVGVGMMFDPTVIWTEPLHLLAVVLIIMIGKSIAAFILVLLLRYTLTTALTVSASLAQIGELSFILVGLGISLGMMPEEGQSLVLSGAIISIALNPLMFKFVEPLKGWMLDHFEWARRLEHRTVPFSQLPETTETAYLAGQVVVVGFDVVGKKMTQSLREQSIPFVVIDQHRDVAESLREAGMAAVCGDAVDPAVLIQAHITNAAMLVISTPDPISVSRIIETAKTLNPEVEVVLYANSEEEARLFEEEGYGKVFVAERELGVNMSKHVVERFAAPARH